MSGLYNMVNGYNPACIFFLPMLGRKAEEYPRFRDCFISESEDSIIIFTRVGGYNRSEHDGSYGEEFLYEDENFIRTWDDESDNTYGYYEFKVPDKWKPDVDLILNGKFAQISKEYLDVLHEFYPAIDFNKLVK